MRAAAAVLPITRCDLDYEQPRIVSHVLRQEVVFPTPEMHKIPRLTPGDGMVMLKQANE